MGVKTISPRRQSRPQEIARMQDFAPFTPELLRALSPDPSPYTGLLVEFDSVRMHSNLVLVAIYKTFQNFKKNQNFHKFQNFHKISIFK
jgi:hypothetical protein